MTLKYITFRIFRILKTIIVSLATTGYKIWKKSDGSNLFFFEYGKWKLEEKCVFIKEESGLRFPLRGMVSPQTSLKWLFYSMFPFSIAFSLLP